MCYFLDNINYRPESVFVEWRSDSSMPILLAGTAMPRRRYFSFQFTLKRTHRSSFNHSRVQYYEDEDSSRRLVLESRFRDLRFARIHLRLDAGDLSTELS